MSDGVEGDRIRWLNYAPDEETIGILFPNDTSRNLMEHPLKDVNAGHGLSISVERVDRDKAKMGYVPKAHTKIDSNIKRKSRKEKEETPEMPEPPRHVKIIADALATAFILIAGISFLALFIIGCMVLVGKLI